MSEIEVPSLHNEKRLTFRLLSYWNRIRGERSMPLLRDIAIHEIQELWHFTFTIDVRDRAHPVFQYFGSELRVIFHEDPSGSNVLDALNDVVLNNTIGGYVQCVEKKEPTMEAASFECDGKEFRYRTLCVPFSEDGETVDYIVGTTNYKIFDLS
ncbi:MAG: PAS domain-containing protein [Alphaproteobacteria bacterium]|nr:MAG: PAS domain-containing protein [Alphaproteobacteria bacterium]TAF75302.1 MAG: PAS domain-containing protein [Alphaproteobacteria bacterium]